MTGTCPGVDATMYGLKIAQLQARLRAHAFVRLQGLIENSRATLSTLRTHKPSALAFPRALLLCLALVMQLLALGERELHLGAPPIVEIELERHQRHALALDRPDQLVDLPLVQQQLARALRRMVEAAGLPIFGDVGIDQPDLAAARIRVRFRDRRLAAAQRFHLAAGERDAGLELLADRVVEARLAIFGDDLEVRVLLGRHRVSGRSKRR